MSVDSVGTKPVGGRIGKKRAGKEGVGSFVLYFVMMSISGGLMAGAVAFTWPQFVDDFRLHWSGTLAKESSCEMYEHSGTKSSSSDLIVTWTTLDGVFHHKVMDIYFLWGPNQKKPCVVRYDPARSEHVTASWGFQRVISRLVVAVFALFLTGIGTWAMGQALVMGILRRLGWVKMREG